MNLSTLLSYELFSVKTYSLTVYDVLIIVIIFLITIVALRFIKSLFNRSIRRNRIKKGSAYAIYNLIKYILWVISISLMLSKIGVDVTYVVASSAALMVGLGFGIQQIFSDIVSGLFLIFESNVQVGDVVQLADGEVGVIIEMKLRTSQIRTRDNIYIYVPNSKLISENIINWSSIDQKTRFSVEVGVAYGSEAATVEKALLEAAKEVEGVEKTPAPAVQFKDFADSSLNFTLLFYTHDIWKVEYVKSAIRFKIYEKLNHYNISIPFPQQDVYIKEMPEK
jgi:small-conductance mechanosensitive channel